MKKLLFFAAISLALAPTANAQQVTSGAAQDIPFPEGHSEMLGSDGTSIFVLHDNDVMLSTKVELQIYGADGNLRSSTEVVAPGSEGVMGDSKLYRTTIYGGGQALKFSEGWQKAGKMSSYLVQRIAATGEMDADYTTLIEGPASGQMRAPQYYPVVSPDGSKLGICAAYGIEKGMNARVNVAVFDAKSLDKVWEKELDLQIPSQKGKVYNFAIDNNGNAYVHRNAKIEKKIFKQMLYTTDGKSMKKHELATGRPFMNESMLGHDGDGNVVFAGLCGPKKGTRYDGLFFAHFDAGSRAMTASKLHEPESIQTPGVSTSGALPEFKLRGIAGLPGGISVVMAEEVATLSKSVEGQMGVYDYTYNKGKVLLFGMKSDASQAWANTLDKSTEIRVRGKDSEWDSFGWGVVNGQLHMVYNILDVPRDWTDNNGKQYHTPSTFGNYAMYPTFLEVVGPEGRKAHAQLKYGMPLPGLTFNNNTRMGLYPSATTGSAAGLLMLQRTPAPGKCKVAILR